MNNDLLMSYAAAGVDQDDLLLIETAEEAPLEFQSEASASGYLARPVFDGERIVEGATGEGAE